MKMKSIINRISALVPAPAKRVAKFLFIKEVALNKKAYKALAPLPCLARFIFGGYIVGIINPWLYVSFFIPGIRYIGLFVFIVLLSGHVFTGIPVFVENVIQEGGINVHPVKAVKKIFSGLVEKVRSFIAELASAAKGE